MIKKEASAIYAAVYQRAGSQEQLDWRKVNGLRFAWRVAGDALLELIRPPSSWYKAENVAYELYGRRKD